MSFNPDSDLSGTIARLFVYPVKSCAGIEVQQALLTETGLDLDRAWMVVDAQGIFLTQRSLPRMALIRPQLKTDEMVLRAPGMLTLHVTIDAVEAPSTVTVWRDTVPAWDMGAVAAQWFTDFLGQPCRLVRFDPEHRRLSSMAWTGGVEAPNQFADGFPVLVASEASLEELNGRLVAAGHAAVGMERFRPNVVLAGLDAHDEDRVDLVRVDGGAEGDVHLQPVKPCARCPIPNIDPATAQIDPAVGDTLRAYRQDKRLNGAVTFGMNAIVRQGAGQLLRVGQRIGADLRFD
ncbi:MAG: MOSC N-terminal beta barrel domain-containing protein [Burkholderiaceae bacterium]|nr:MOSC N-terminal beta barrel domain-containing protein [Burkholderiaceae bacterium]